MAYTQHDSDAAVVLTPRTAPRAAVIWLHGLGADGFDFVPIATELRVEDLGVRFVFPHAAMRPVTINNGYVMRAWYDILGLSAGSREDEEGVRESARVVDQFIENEVRAGIAADRIVVAGFSQGGAVALHAALRYPQRLAGVLALSTYLPLRTTLPTEAAAANRTTPILMCHGVQDSVVPLMLGRASHDVLQTLGFAIEWRTYPMAHSVNLDEVADIAAWLKRVLA